MSSARSGRRACPKPLLSKAWSPTQIGHPRSARRLFDCFAQNERAAVSDLLGRIRLSHDGGTRAHNAAEGEGRRVWRTFAARSSLTCTPCTLGGDTLTHFTVLVCLSAVFPLCHFTIHPQQPSPTPRPVPPTRTRARPHISNPVRIQTSPHERPAAWTTGCSRTARR
jgi:hypothetical protein